MSSTPAGPSAESSSTSLTSPRETSIQDLVEDLSTALESAIGEIHSVNAETRVLSLNARIEAARAGQYGAAFSVVAEEIQELSEKTSLIADSMASRTREKTNELISLIDGSVRGTRLSDLALVNIDLIDRNLYERTCDVRWWATDGSLIDALADDANEDVIAYASKRLGVILDAYTVYYDLVLCDVNGRVIANGRPSQYRSIGQNESSSSWFQSAVRSRSGNDYGFEFAHSSRLVDGQSTLVYSCGVREGGESSAPVIGVLGILFNWRGLAGPILDSIPVSAQEKSSTKACIVNQDGMILASNQERLMSDRIDLPDFNRVLNSPKGFYVAKVNNQSMCIAHAKAPGFETYSTKWYSIVMQPVSE
ncbi:methyl-accepting chemotaxis protein [Neorhodopirellula pilleata]|uniref:Methyl-accepting chemotaxis protein McpC n=1 Tax=Neorhodopirellula pilleata TaxID=2714738 RepID=A0A5C5ZXG3_9BACT|nr:methyl-accepting chemotaxis protein [Neorhodopirellula pilleata]TWT91939.1 Methyl-accepting chemotaxis protein McpC [Neorhodopirellula pilleata]